MKKFLPVCPQCRGQVDVEKEGTYTHDLYVWHEACLKLHIEQFHSTKRTDDPPFEFEGRLC
jgi:hypothetical protein